MREDFLDKIIDFFINKVHIKELGLAICLFLILNFVRYLIKNKVYKLLKKHADKTKNDLDDKIFRNFEKPINLTLFSLCFFLSWIFFLNQTRESITTAISYGFGLKVIETIIVYSMVWGLSNLSKEKSALFDSFKERLGIRVDKILYPFIVKSARVLLVIIGGTIILDVWGIKITTLVAGLGLGGLAFSLAAKDFAANIIGGIALIMEKPFDIGDWIKADGTEGVVEDITFRSTRIRSFAQELVIVPNAILANLPIINFTRRGKRRISFKLGATYNTERDKLKKCVEDIKTMLKGHEDVHQDTIFVVFDDFNSSSLDIFLYFFTKTTNWGEYLATKEDINFKLMKIFEDNGVDFAFPSTSIYIENLDGEYKNEKLDKVVKSIALDKEN